MNVKVENSEKMTLKYHKTKLAYGKLLNLLEDSESIRRSQAEQIKSLQQKLFKLSKVKRQQSQVAIVSKPAVKQPKQVKIVSKQKHLKPCISEK